MVLDRFQKDILIKMVKKKKVSRSAYPEALRSGAKKKEIVETKVRLNSWELGLAGGILSGISVFLMTLAGKFFGVFSQFLNLILDIYGFIGYDITIFGAFLGGALSFIDCFIFFWLLGVLYNSFK